MSSEALRLADWLQGAVATYPQVSECEPGGYCSELDQRVDEAVAMLRTQAARIAELESRVHTCGPTCSKAGCINRRVTAERDTLRAELETERMRLSACGVVAMANTAESAAKVRTILADCEARDVDDPELEQVAQDIEQLRSD